MVGYLPMAAVSVTTSATLVATGDGSAAFPAKVLITNDSGNSVYLGKDATVETTTGAHLGTGTSFGADLVVGREVWAIAGSTSEVRAEVWG